MAKRKKNKALSNTNKKKANKPQPHRNPFTQRLIEKQAKLALQSVWIADGKCLGGITHSGIYDRSYPTPSGMNSHTWAIAVGDEVTRMIAEAPVEWTVWYAVFESDGEKNWVEARWQTFPAQPSNELGDDVHNLLQKLVDGRNPKFVISHGWLATPKTEADMEMTQEDIIKKFTEWGAFNKDFCKALAADRRIREMEAEETKEKRLA